MYTLADHAGMMADAIRIDAYAAALQQAVRAESVVADLGAGIGTFSLLAARFGARKVYAIEPEDTIHLGRAIAAASGLADRIEFVQARSTDVVLPERATIIVSDMRGTLPQFERHIPAIADARQRLLADGGVLIPCRDRLWAAIVDAPEVYADHVTPWRDHTHGLALQPAEQMLANTWRKTGLTPHLLLSDSRCLAALDYHELVDPDLDVEATWTTRRAGTGHGLCVWFDSELIDGVSFSNAPEQPGAIHGQAFFPFAAPVALSDGAVISVRLQANLIGDDYIWRWTTLGRTQSTFYGVPLAAEQLSKRTADHVPVLGSDGEIDLFILARMQESMPLGDIARELLARFPAAIRDWNAALGRTGEVSRKYSKL
jgi:type I protein arginine methyltransferase